MAKTAKDVEFRIMPSGDGRGWYWEVISAKHVIARVLQPTMLRAKPIWLTTETPPIAERPGWMARITPGYRQVRHCLFRCGPVASGLRECLRLQSARSINVQRPT
jgi:hypothetical protein